MIDDLLGSHVVRVDHVGIATWSIAESLSLYQGVLGGRFLFGGDLDDRSMRTVQLAYPGGAKVELLEPTAPDAGLTRFLEDRGPGIHHMTVVVKDVVAVIEELTAAGFELTGTRLGSPRWRETYLRPSSAGGVLLQLADTTRDWSVPVPGVTLDGVLAGEVAWHDYQPTPRAAVEVAT